MRDFAFSFFVHPWLYLNCGFVVWSESLQYMSCHSISMGAVSEETNVSGIRLDRCHEGSLDRKRDFFFNRIVIWWMFLSLFVDAQCTLSFRRPLILLNIFFSKTGLNGKPHVDPNIIQVLLQRRRRTTYSNNVLIGSNLKTVYKFNDYFVYIFTDFCWTKYWK